MGGREHALSALTPAESSSARLEFLRTLYGDEAPGYLVLWTLPEKTSRWISADQLATAARHQRVEDVYFGLALQDQEKALELAGASDPTATRGRAASTIALPCVWLDIDVRGPAHTRPDLPPTVEDAYKILEDFPLKPTIVINSGNGLHVYWCFKELWRFDDDSERAEAEGLSRRFQETLRAVAGDYGWEIDNTSSLAAVLRLPGTVNTKHGERRPVEIVGRHPEHRYEPSEIERYLIEELPDRAPALQSSGVDTAAILAGVPEGQRDQELFRLASKLRGADVPRDWAEHLVLEAAENCDPPFPEKEALAKVKSAYDRYPAGRQGQGSLATSADLAEEPPRPLMRDRPEVTPFPVDQLGEILAPAALAIQEKTQAPLSLCGQSVLATSTLSVQGLANVELPTGAIRPISCYFLSVAETGERKSSADELALQPVRRYEGELQATYRRERRAYKIAHEAWKKQKSQELGDSNSSQEGKRAALKRLGPEPKPPLVPLLTCPEPTFEGLHKWYEAGRAALGVFSTEGGQFIGGHGMNKDNRLKTAAGFSALWDGEPLKRVRAVDPFAVLPGRRLAVHLLVQPGVAAGLLSDPLLADQGLLSRFLATEPERTAGTRFWKDASEEAEQALMHYQQHLSQVLSRPLPLAPETRNELRPRDIRLCPLARKIWIKFADFVEEQLGSGGEYEAIRGLGNKLPEHATRLATVIALVEDPDLQELSAPDLARGIELAKFYAQEALRLFERGTCDPDLNLAARLLKWLHGGWQEELISLPDIYQLGPRPIRDQKTARRIVAILVEHGYLLAMPKGTMVAGSPREEVWRIRE